MATGITAVDNVFASLPTIVAGIVLLIVAWIVTTIIKGALSKGLKKVGFQRLLVKWGVTKKEDDASNTIDSIAKVAYYII